MLRFQVMYLLHIVSFNRISSTSLEKYLIASDFQTITEEFPNFEIGFFDKCFSDNWPTVIIGNLSIIDTTPKGLIHSITNKTIYLLNNEKNEMQTRKKTISFTPETYHSDSVTATKFVLFTKNRESLLEELIKLKNSLFWNIYGYFFVVNTKNCLSTYPDLETIWEFNILNAIYCCPHSTYGISYYIFNPFNGAAPEKWQQVAVLRQKNNHPLRIFKKLTNTGKGLEEVVANCEAFSFEKTKSLAGYPINVMELNEYTNITNEVGNICQKDIYELGHKIMRLIWTKLDSAVEYTQIPGEQLGIIQSNGSVDQYLTPIIENLFETRSDLDFVRGFWKNEVSTFSLSGICYATRKELNPLLKQLKKAFPLASRINYLVFFFISTCIYVHLTKANSIDVALDILRVILGQFMIYKPQDQFSSFIFWAIVLTSMALTTMLQSQLNAIVTASPTIGREISTFHDLVAYNYQVYGETYYNQYFYETKLENNISPVSNFAECLEMMERNSSIACVTDCLEMRYNAQEDDEVHITKESMFSRYDAFFFRHDSPLRERFQYICIILLQSGITQFFLKTEESDHKKSYGSVFANITIHQLRWPFYILFIFFFVCLVIFIVELLVYYLRKLYKWPNSNELER